MGGGVWEGGACGKDSLYILSADFKVAGFTQAFKTAD